ncbi:hypothetical protein IFM89_009842 [Coptis chinensis]|uniref:Helicase ATP-binding domain-containing protein n=1 Tax=Coptis chinensis TaxID=261450 RepID=A0A835HZC8_9MAGN|nr:hypothetical protein IFM89_009842 [Coptis chinensis]
MNDDDEFDWEAAVKAIDVACQERAVSSTFASTSAPASKPSRQSTLDSFIQRNNHCQVVGNEESNNLGCYCAIDLEAAKTWIYPVNIPLRDYQLSITKTALFANTLVALPTGLGKTLIAAVVMYNYFRWFPEGKIVFAAPSRPLVLQQIEACHNTVGIPQEWAIDLTGQTNPSKRAYLWKAKRVFFVTPQVLEKDIQSGTCLVKHLVCLVIDEAHRASGNYSYCVAVRELMAVPLQFRILALTATPGSKQQAIQKVIDNLQISKLEYRTETDDDVSPYVHNRKLELVKVPMGKDAVEINDMILEAIRPFVTKLTSFGVHLNRDSQTLSPCDLLNTRDKFRQAPPQDLSHLKYGEVEGCFGVLITLYHVRKLLSSHGIRPAFDMLEEKLKQGDIMNSLSSIGESVKATEFIGQSSGKVLKGQTQKIQQAVLQFVPRGKKVKDDSFDDQAFKNKLSDAETELIAKYFSSSGEYTWKPSLIAFPHFQAFPSRVHNVMHSFKTRMLIGTMQHLQALSFSMDDKVPPCEVQGMISSYQCVGAESLTRHDRSEKDFEAVSGVIASPSAKHHISDSPSQNCPIHFSHFENAYVSVKRSGTVSIAYVPSLPFVKESHLRNRTELLNTVKKNSSLSTTSTGDHCELSMQMNLANPADSNGINNCFTPGSRFCFLNSLQKAVPPGVEEVVLTPSPKRSCINSEVIIVETPTSTRRNLPILLANDSTSDVKDIEMSPRLTNMVEKGVVPESPLAENGNHSYNGHAVSRNSSSKCVNYQSVRSCSREIHSSEISKDSMLHAAKLPSFGLRRQLLSPVHAPFAFGNGLPIKNLGTAKSEDSKICITAGAVGEESASPINGDICTPVQIHTSVNARGNSSGFPVNVEPRTPFVNLTNSCSSDWHLSSGEQPKITQHAPKFRRLRKYGECSKKDSSEIMKDVLTGPVSNIAGSTTRANRVNRVRGKRKMETQARAFIEEEAEVSADAEVSDDEEEDTNNNSTDDSFIDDRINPTVESTQAEAIRRDMMAIYRSDNLLVYLLVGYDPETSLQPQRLFHLEETGESSLQCQPKSNELNGDVFCDDQFYEGLDLDALEAQATKLLKHKSELSMDRKQCDFPNPVTEKGPELSHSPSFDLGI